MAIVTVFLAPGAFGAGGQFLDQNGAPLSLGQIATYLAGTTTPAATYTSPGLTQAANANPILLNPDGRPPQEIWIPQGVAMKFTVADALGTIIATYDNLSGVNDPSAQGAASEWVSLNLTPTQLNATQFSVPGNVTGILHTDRRIQTVNGGGTLYGAIVSSSFAAGVTTVTVRTDTGQALDSGLSSVLYAFVSAFPGNTSIPMADTNPITGTTDATRRLKLNADRITTGQTRTLTMQDADLDIGDPSVCRARLTFTQGTPFTTADVLAATAIFMQPVAGDRIALFDGTAWNIRTFTQAVTVAVPNTTTQMYDVFAAFSAGNVILELVAWTNDTTRATQLALQNGVLVKTGDATRRYMGSFRTTAVAGQSEDSAAKRYLWNYYNRATRTLNRVDPAASWTYSTATFRQANGSAANQVEVVIGVAEDPVSATVLSTCVASSPAAGGSMVVGIGIDSSTVNSAVQSSAPGFPGSITTTNTFTPSAAYRGFLPIGKHDLRWLEWASQATTTWVGTNGAVNQSGITGEVRA